MLGSGPLDHAASDGAAPWPAWRALEELPAGTAIPVDASDPGAARVDRERSLRCRRCQRDITTSRAAVEVQGAHTHTFFNPAGILFEIGCFAEAPGCALVGPPSTEFAWFAGHSWRIAVCGGCGQHLGWLFTGPGVFFGLVLRHLRED